MSLTSKIKWSFNTGTKVIDNIDYTNHEHFYKIQNKEKFGNDLEYIPLQYPWEYKIIQTIDEDEKNVVIFWSYKNYIIPYINPITKLTELYTPDYYILCKHNKLIDTCSEIIYEIYKEEIELIDNELPENFNELEEEEQYSILDIYEYGKILKEKYSAISKYCKHNGIQFKILNDDQFLEVSIPMNNQIN